MTASEIRQSFLDFFREQGHTIVPSSSLLPSSPNLLFTNAGMNQFVPYFLGTESAPYTPPRATDTQKCIRAGGKHNDLDDVGFDSYHHTFFEMLGNWSFGDYFKTEAIDWAWELVVNRWGLPPQRLYATVYRPADGDPGDFDQDAWDCWAKHYSAAGLDPDVQIVDGNRKDNFWMMGETGPCGPCSELHMDLTPNGDTKGSLVNADSPLCIEIWNLVFIQFNAEADGSFRPLPSCHVDTGMGFERVCAIIECTNGLKDFSKPVSNYDTGVFKAIFAKIAQLSNRSYTGLIPTSRTHQNDREQIDVAFRVIGDHIRTLCFAIADGIEPGNTDRNYVVRRILRRAVRFGRVLGLGGGNETFLPEIGQVVIEDFGSTFPELESQREHILAVLKLEEENFNRTLDRGLELFQKAISKVKSDETTFPPAIAFKLYDTYGFPVDLTEVLVTENNLKLDLDAVNTLMDEQRDRARKARKSDVISAEETTIEVETKFVGYHQVRAEARIVEEVIRGNDHYAVVDASPFYAEMGGQLGDTGTITVDGRSIAVTDTVKLGDSFFLKLAEPLALDTSSPVDAILEVDTDRRHAIEAHHTATHLLNWALHEAVSASITQKGSQVGPDRLRFDFNSAALTNEQIAAIEDKVNRSIVANATVSSTEIPYDQVSSRTDVIQAFGEKYGDVVRVVQIGGASGKLNGYSMELCGGTHTQATGQLGLFKITSEGAISAGIRRIEATCGLSAITFMNGKLAEQTAKTAELEKKLQETSKTLEKERAAAIQQQAESITADLLAKAHTDAAVPFIAEKVAGADGNVLQALLGSLKQKGFDGVAVLFGTGGGRVHLAVSVGKAYTKAFQAGKILQQVAPLVGGKGGGKPEQARGAGTDPSGIPAAIEAAVEVLG